MKDLNIKLIDSFISKAKQDKDLNIEVNRNNDGTVDVLDTISNTEITIDPSDNCVQIYFCPNDTDVYILKSFCYKNINTLSDDWHDSCIKSTKRIAPYNKLMSKLISASMNIK